MYNGIINIYKESGYTSHDVVAKMRGILGQRKIGHTGTLDPDAVGVLPVCLGQATKLCDMLTDRTKEYKATLLLGIKTDTEDTSGNVIEKNAVNATNEEVRAAILSFVGEYNQIPPMYSAKKQDGKKLVDLARQGIVVERKPCLVNIYDIAIESINIPEVTFTTRCSKGTYIRTLCKDIGDRLGCGGCMKSLIRTRVAGFDIKDAISLGEVTRLKAGNILDKYIIPIDEVLCEYKEKLYVKAEFDKNALSGNMLALKCFEKDVFDFEDKIKIRAYDSSKKFLGIYEYIKADKIFKPYKLFIGETK